MPPPLINKDGTFNNTNEWLRYWSSRITRFLTFPQWVLEWCDKMEQARKNKVAMAKNYRQAPLIGADDSTGLPVQNERETKAADLLGRMVARFDDEFIMHVATEIGLDECLSYGATKTSLVFDCTPLQMIAIGAALAACAEYRDAQPRTTTKSKRRRG